MKRSLTRQLIIILSVVATIVVNGLANALPLNGQQTGEVSDRFPVYFVPAGYVFAIWGVIYAGLIAYAVYQALPAQRTNLRLAAIDAPFVIASLANIVWIFLWHYEVFPGTMAVMLVLLGALMTIYLRLGINKFKVPSAERWAVHVPFSIYLGWITGGHGSQRDAATLCPGLGRLGYLSPKSGPRSCWPWRRWWRR